MKLIYIAGPFNGARVEDNIRAAEALAVELAHVCPEAQPVVPHSLGRVLYGVQSESRAYEGTAALLLRCDALLLMPTWHLSCGARAERRLAEKQGLPVFESVGQVRDWLDGARP